jgi:hypothetical protein
VLTLFVALFLSGTTNKRVAVMEIGVDKTSKSSAFISNIGLSIFEIESISDRNLFISHILNVF